MRKKRDMGIKCILICVLSVILVSIPAYAWINGVGGPSNDPNNPSIGTHDRMLNDAIEMLPANFQSEIDIIAADYGSEMPDFNSTECNCMYGIGDKKYHEVYYYRNGTAQNDDSARRAQEEYNLAMTYFGVGDKYNFSIHIGMMSHYIADVSNFAHTMGPGSDWGDEGDTVHSAYENFVADGYSIFFSSENIKFGGVYADLSAYDATLYSANDVTFDNKFGNGTYTNVWMYNSVNNSISNYTNNSLGNYTNLSSGNADPRLIARTSQSLNYSVNLMADVIYMMLSQTGDMLSYYRGLGLYPNIVETSDLLKAADDWRNNVASPGFVASVTTAQLLTLADEWRNS